ncbi:Hsp70 family protein [Phytohabitans sp. ZYX-F-186]|uniref:Hsp70 family protein n=1 Tax=Phytohabitans maris TaxID=3071409 RepID=A0ABU0ZUD4_9ACTN|nr:Hsp70 family protein [Phytohabitans sp. ZYX-F-186]MDQ7910653.1 Hsp70 family protein [Phytohabitans sp. ZYX-F-186]
MAGPDGGYALGVDVGTSNTVAVLRWPDGRTRPLLFDGQPITPSAVFLDDAGLHVGRDAQRLAQGDPSRFEPNPKRRVDEPSVLLGGREVPTVDLLAAVLGAVARTAVEAVGFLPPAVVTHPAAWGSRRREVLAAAIARAGWPPVGDPGTKLLAEPVAAARYFAEVLRRPVPVGASLAVFDFGGGTLDIAVVRNEGTGFAVIGSGGVAELGGLDLDAALVDHLGRVLAPTHPQAWQALAHPATAGQWRSRRQFWDDVRGAKEMLSRTSAAPVPVPGIDQAVHLTREELERLVTPLLRRGVYEAASVIGACGLTPSQLAGLFLVGGSSRVPLVARMLHADLGIAPTVLEQPELPVAEGALAELSAPRARAVASVPAVSSATAAREMTATPTSGPGLPVSSVPVSPSGSPVSAVPGMSVSPAPPSPPRRPLYRRPVLWVAAAAVALIGVVAAAALVLLRNDEVDFQPVAEVDRIPSADSQPYYVYTDVVGDRGYLAYEQTGQPLTIVAVELATAKELWRVPTTSVSDRWDGISALPGAVVAFQSSSISSTETRDMAVHDPANGKQMWHRLIGPNDAVYPFKDVLVLVDTGNQRVLGLDLKTGGVRWDRPSPGKEQGLTGTAVYPVQTVEDVSGPASVSGRPFAPRTDDDQRFVLIGADRSATVIDASNNRELSKRTNVADPSDDAVAYNGRLLVATDEGGYRLSAYDLDTMGEPVNLYTAPEESRQLDVLAMCGETRVCLLDSAGVDSKSTEVVAIDLEKGGQLWRAPAPDAGVLVHFGEEVVAQATSGDYPVRIFDPDGNEILKRDGAVGRVDAGNLLLFDEVASYADDYSVAGLHVGSTDVIEMGQLKDVKTDTCSWNRTYIVCAGTTDFLVARFARD